MSDPLQRGTGRVRRAVHVACYIALMSIRVGFDESRMLRLDMFRFDMFRFDMGRIDTKRQGPGGRLASRVLGSLLFALFFGLGCVFVVVIAREAWQGFESRSWIERPATIVRADVSVVGGDNA